MRLRVGEMFAGIGGVGLGLERAGMEVRWHAEIDPYAVRVLAKHWPDVPNHGDVTAIDYSTVEPVDVIAGGFPCQDISIAGNEKGLKGERSGLWGEIVRAADYLRPSYLLVENVANLLSGGGGQWFGTVLGDLAALGYDAEWSVVPACALGAPHTRERVFIVAYRDGIGRWGSGLGVQRGAGVRARFRHWQATPNDARWENVVRWFEQIVSTGGGIVPSSEFRGVVDGVPSRLDRVRGTGNAVVPQVAELIGGWIVAHARQQREVAA